MDHNKLETSPTPVGDDISDFFLTEQRFKASWGFENLTNKRPKRRMRKSTEGHASTPVKRTSPSNVKTPLSPSVRKEVMMMERPSIWMDVGLILLVLGVIAGLLWVIYDGVDRFWEY